MSTVTLIRPPSIVARFGLTLNATPPLSLAYLAGSLAAVGHNVQVIDAVGLALDAVWPSYRPGLLGNGLTVGEIVARVDPSAVMIGVSALFSHEWPVIRELFAALAARFPSVPLVCGGEHATAVPELCLDDAPALHACVLGEGEETAIEIVSAIERGVPLASVPGLAVRADPPARGARRTAPRGRIRAIDAIPLPRWDLVPIEAYLSRGLSFGVDRGRTMPLLATRGCPYRCTFCSSPSMERTLDRILKKVDLDRMEASMRAAVESGLSVKANILVGFPGESHADIADTLRFMWRMARAGVHDASVWTFSPYPGSQLYDELRASGRIGAMDDDYFASLLSYSDLRSAVSYDELVSSEALQRYRLAGLFLFYGASFLLHPDRPVRSALRVARGRYESRTEMSLVNLVRRLRRASSSKIGAPARA